MSHLMMFTFLANMQLSTWSIVHIMPILRWNTIYISEQIFKLKNYYLFDSCDYQMPDFINFQRSPKLRCQVFLTVCQLFLIELLHILANIERQRWCKFSQYQTKFNYCFVISTERQRQVKRRIYAQRISNIKFQTSAECKQICFGEY